MPEEPSRRNAGAELGRREVVAVAAALGATALMPVRALAQSRDAAAEPSAAPFSFDALSEAARRRASEPYEAPRTVPDFVEGMTYDQYRNINFPPENSLWGGDERRFWLQAFHLGWLFDTPVAVHEVVDGEVRALEFTSDDFVYRNSAEGLLTPGTALPGVSGFRISTPLNRPDVYDELAAFQGASYFRALGRDNAYGLSARGLAINTATGGDEEFPRFSAFYLARPEPGEESLTLYADLDSESVTGAYRFVITPGAETAMDVTARLYFRRDVEHLGIAPLTSMFLYDETNRWRFDDYRPQVHDSNGLRVRRAGGDALWRALANPPRLATSYFSETSPAGFGLHQRDREFEDYEDAGARYQDRPSVEVDFLGDWGEGAVRLVEIPSDLEINDNVVAYWSPSEPAAAGSSREYAYRLRWGMLPPEGGLAHVSETRTGTGGVSGVEGDGDGARKFVIDFEGGRLGVLGPDAEVEARFSASRGEVVTQVLFKLEGRDTWRLVADVVPEPDATMELVAFVEGYDERLSETWLYQWIEAS